MRENRCIPLSIITDRAIQCIGGETRPEKPALLEPGTSTVGQLAQCQHSSDEDAHLSPGIPKSTTAASANKQAFHNVYMLHDKNLECGRAVERQITTHPRQVRSDLVLRALLAATTRLLCSRALASIESE